MDKLNKFLDIFYENGFEAYGVGGCVRDFLLGLKVHDYDVTTNANPNQIKTLFKDYKLNLIGEKYSTIGVHYNDAWFEVTTYRQESDYQNNRHPKQVLVVNSLKEDLKRRDFTINAMAIYKDNIIDLFQGQFDLQRRIIRTVGDPNQRFQEDALRILRALRFVSQLGFHLDHGTNVSLLEHKDLLLTLSKERITSEIKGLILGNHVNQVIDEYPEILEYLFGYQLEKIISGQTFETRIMRMLMNAETLDWTNSLKLSKAELNTLNTLLKYKDGKFSLIRIMRDLTQSQLKSLVEFHHLEIELEAIKKGEMPYLLKQLKIDGNDLVELSVKKSNRNKLMNKILDLIQDNQLNNERDELLEFIQNKHDFV